MLKKLLATAGSAIASALSNWGSAIATVFGFGRDIAAAIHDENERVAGENRIVATDNAAAAKVNADVAQAALTPDAAIVDSLRTGKF